MTTPDPAPRVDASHPLVAKVLDLYRAAIRDGDTPEDLAARYVATTLRVLADPQSEPYVPLRRGALRALADEIDPPEAAP